MPSNSNVDLPTASPNCSNSARTLLTKLPNTTDDLACISSTALLIKTICFPNLTVSITAKVPRTILIVPPKAINDFCWCATEVDTFFFKLLTPAVADFIACAVLSLARISMFIFLVATSCLCYSHLPFLFFILKCKICYPHIKLLNWHLQYFRYCLV